MRRWPLTLVLLAAAAAVVAGGMFLLCRAPGKGQVEGLRIVCAGDSITRGSSFSGYPAHLEAILIERGVQCRVENRGRPGNTSGEYLAYLVPERMFAKEDADFVLLQLGTNDVRIDGDRTDLADFVDRMERIIGIIKSSRNSRGRSPRILLGLIPPIVVTGGTFDDESPRRVTGEINPAIRELARRHGLTVVDNYELFIRRPELLPGIHPSDEGYRVLAENWADALMRELDRSKETYDH